MTWNNILSKLFNEESLPAEFRVEEVLVDWDLMSPGQFMDKYNKTLYGYVKNHKRSLMGRTNVWEAGEKVFYGDEIRPITPEQIRICLQQDTDIDEMFEGMEITEPGLEAKVLGEEHIMATSMVHPV